MHRFIRTLLFAAVLGALAIGAAPAGAAEVVKDGSTLVLRGKPGEKNFLSVRVDDFNTSRIEFTDRTSYPMTADPSCTVTQTGFGRFASCSVAGITHVRLEGADGDDELDISPHDLPISTPVTLDGGPGADDVEGPTTDLPVILRGGDGPDKLYGGQGPDTLDGGPGDDDVDGNDGNDTVLGGEGDDTVAGGRRLSADLVDGGPGRDVSADWGDPNDRQLALTVTLDGVADDGRPGEGDDVRGIEAIETHRVATLIAGADPVEFSVTNTPAGDSRLVGSPGNDRLRSGSYNDRIEAGAGADAVAAGAGDDTIVGGPGPDTILADGGVICDFISCSGGLQGNDTIDARDGERDSVDCGPGTDTALLDAVDVHAGCENVAGAPAPVPSPAPSPAPRPAPRSGGRTTRRACVVPKVRRGATLRAARRALTQAGCRVTTTRVRSQVRRGRVVGLGIRVKGRVRRLAAGRRLAANTTVVVRLSRGRR